MHTTPPPIDTAHTPAEWASFTRLLNRALLAATSGAVVLLLLSWWTWSGLEPGKQVPVHWNIRGEVDRWGSPAEGLLLIPGLLFGFSLMFRILPHLEPRQFHLVESRRAYVGIWAGLAVFFAVIHGAICLSALGYAVGVARLVTAAIGGLFLLLGYFLGQIRSNFFFGIRTPWTLSSEESWRRTHALGGKAFMALGGVMLLAPLLLPASATMVVLIAGLLGVTLGLVVYSWWVWRSDAGR